MNLIIDCDPGHDDAVAILLAHRHARLLGVTTVSGNTSLANTTTNALALLESIGARVPVHSGAECSLNGETRHAQHVHGKTGFGGVEMPAPKRQVDGRDAVQFLLSESRRVSDLVVIAIGPLTNIALAIQADPDFVRRIKTLSIMGGSTDTGNATPVAEFNVWADPEAAHVVFNSGAQIKMCGLNLTRQLRTDDRRLEALTRGGATANLVARLYRFMHERMQALTGERRAALHDPCAVLAITHPALVSFAALHVDVEVHGRLTRGMTVVDQRLSQSKLSPNAQVAVTIDAERAWEVIRDALFSYP